MVSYVLCLSVWLNTISSRPIHVAVNGHLCSFCGWVMFHCVCVYTPHRLYWWGGVFPGVAGFNREPWGCKPWPQSGAFQCGPPGRGGGVGGCVEGEPWLNSSEAQPVLAGCSEATLDFGSERGVWYPCRKTSLLLLFFNSSRKYLVYTDLAFLLTDLPVWNSSDLNCWFFFSPPQNRKWKFLSWWGRLFHPMFQTIYHFQFARKKNSDMFDLTQVIVTCNISYSVS